MVSVGLRATAFRRAAPWLLASGLALGCSSASKSSYGNDASLPDSSGVAGANADALGDTGGAAAAGTGVPDAVSDSAGAAGTAIEDAADATSDAPPDGAAQGDADDPGGAAGSPAPPPCVLGSSTIGACVVE